MLIMIVDDEAGVRNSLNQLLKDNHDVVLCQDGAEALQKLEKMSIDLVVTDYQMPKVNGLDLIKKGKELSPNTSFILLTAFGTVKQAVEAIQLGADDYLMKPFDLAEIEHRVQRVADLQSWKTEHAIKMESGKGVARIMGRSSSIQAAKAFVEKVALVPSPVLILGPSGSGKEILAKAIHESGPRAQRPFVAINCASLSEQLMESELFGHEKGAFTGATAAKPGKFELAKGGTLFLDEVGELSAPLQAKLLRVLQEKEFYRVGGVRQIKSDARVVAATHQPLKEMVKSGTFREDLFFRLNVLMFELAPLAERKEDIPDLIQYFWAKLGKELGSKARLGSDAFEILCSYSYPGNVRELQNLLERLMVLNGQMKEIPAQALPGEVRGMQNSGGGTPLDIQLNGRGLNDILGDLERKIIDQVMAECGNNQSKAASILKITRGALQYKLKKDAA